MVLVSILSVCDDAESFEELVEVYVPVFVEIDAAGQVANAALRYLDVHVVTEQLPDLAELFERDESCQGQSDK